MSEINVFVFTNLNALDYEHFFISMQRSIDSNATAVKQFRLEIQGTI